MPFMAAISGIEPVANAQPPPPREERNATAANFGAAVSQREAVQDKRRVEPSAVADKKKAPSRMREDDPRNEGKGQHVDISV